MSFGKSSYAVRKTLKGIAYERKVTKKEPLISKKIKSFKCAKKFKKFKMDFESLQFRLMRVNLLTQVSNY